MRLCLGILVFSTIVFAGAEPVNSRYTSWLKKKLEAWPSAEKHAELAPDELKIEALETKGERYYVGIHQWMRILAPLARVTEIVENIADYEKYLPGSQKIKVIAKHLDYQVTSWEQPIPVFFIPNVKFNLRYDVDKKPHRTVFTYQLLEKDSLDACDGLIVLEAKGNETYYTEYSFSLTSGGLLHAVGPIPIWKDSIKSAFLSKQAQKLRAEHPDWNLDKVKSEAEERWKSFPAQRVFENKILVN